MILVQLIKFTLISSIVIGYFLTSSLITFFIRSPWQRRSYLSRFLTYSCRIILKVLNVKIQLKFANGESAPPQGRFFIVSNHLSYLDILILASVLPISFVTSQEMKEDPFLGPILVMAGCLFVERRSRKFLNNEISEIANGLKQGLNVCIFPEATSSDGSQLLRFRRPLYNAAISTESPVLPLCLNYKTIDGETVTPQNRDRIFWYGDMTFFPHYWNIMKTKEITLSLEFLQTIPTQKEMGNTRLVARSQERITEVFQPIVEPGL